MSRWKQKDPNVQAATPEKLRIEIDNVFRTFMDDPEMEHYDFSADLNNLQRKYIHEKAKKLNLQSKSHGKEPNRILTIYKRKKLVNYESFFLNLSDAASNSVNRTLAHSTSVSNSAESKRRPKKQGNDLNFGRIQYSKPVSVKAPLPNPLLDFRKTLPVYSSRDTILETIDKNRVVIISSETGSGKTTQIPQYLLEDAADKGLKCRIVCTQPRRISAVAVAERVAAERGEQLGGTVGYSIRLESKMGLSTALYYCTNGILLRTLMHDSESIFDFTHVIVDEIHERDKFSDFLLIVLKEGLQRNPNLKVILMSATLKTQIFESYFEGALTCHIPGRVFPIRELFLEDILRLISYESEAMSNVRKSREHSYNHPKTKGNHVHTDMDHDMEDAIVMCINYGSDDCFDQLLQLIVSEDANVNYQHSETLFTGLMAAAIHGNYDVVEKLIFLGADITLTCAKGKTACDWAEYYNKYHIVNLLRDLVSQNVTQGVLQQRNHPAEQLLLDYDKTITDEQIDFNLIIGIIRYIHNSQLPGSILVFLPGYDDILQCHEFLSGEPRINEFAVFLLHGSMQIGAQHSVFNLIPDKRKIILSTNVAETSITIDDVVYVIDTGRAKEKTFDAISCIGALQTTWISKACAKQRAGRAGRTREGMCFHIYSRDRFESMQTNRTPEILRVSLHELCLHTKKLAPEGMAIASFLAQAIEPPSSISVQSAVQSLQALGALDEEEHLTSLGEHLLQLSAEPHLAKMLIYSTILKCVDPVLTIVSCLAHKDPFVLPAQGKMKANAQAKRKSLCFEALSDHMSFIRVFQLWQEAKMKNMDKKFCKEYYVSSATMEMILQTRVQLLGQLRAAGFVQPSPPDNIQSLNKYAESWPVVKAVLIVGLYPNLAYVQNKKITTRTEKRVGVHTSSCLSKYLDDNKRHPFHNWVVFEELSKTGQFCSIKCATIIAPIVVALMCGKATLSDIDGFSINIDDWLEFEPSNHNLFQYRLKLEEVITKKVTHPAAHLNTFESCVVDSLYEILSAEDAVVHLRHPEGIGLPPRFISDRENMPSRSQERNGFGGRRYTQNSYGRGYGAQEFKMNTQYFSNALKIAAGSSGVEGNHFVPFVEEGRRFRRNTNGRFGPPLRSFKVSMHQRELGEHVEFFVIKPNRIESVDVSLQQGTWTFSPQTERKVVRAFNEGKEVILFFTVHSTGCFQGVARLLGTTAPQNVAFPIHWLCRVDLRHQETHTLLNPYNNYRRIFYCDDGQPVESEVGRRLFNMFFDTHVPDQRNCPVRPILGSTGN